MRINNALWYLLFNLPSQSHRTWQANLKERITVRVACGKGRCFPNKKWLLAACVNYSQERKVTSYQISYQTIQEMWEKEFTPHVKINWSPCLLTFSQFQLHHRWWYTWQTFFFFRGTIDHLSATCQSQKQPVKTWTEQECISRIKCKKITPLFSLPVADSGCWRGRGEKCKKGTCCILQGTNAQNVVRHCIAFCLPERHPREHFTTFFLHRKGVLY